jgi:hypothetical protein
VIRHSRTEGGRRRHRAASRTPRAIAPAAFATAALLIAGCGGSSHSSSSSEQASASSTTTSGSTSSETTTTSSAATTKRKRKRTQKTQSTTSHTITASTSAPPKPPKHLPAPLIYTGSGTRSVGDIKIHYASYLDWKCAGTCAPFQINNSLTDAAAINVDAGGPGSGTVVVQPGTYHKVTVTTDGDWTLTVKAVP